MKDCIRDKGTVLPGSKIRWKAREDCTRGKRGWVGGNPRYNRRRAAQERWQGKNRTMGRNIGK